LLGLLLLTHIQLFERLAIENMSILKFTWQQIKQAETAALFGGGIIGGLLLACCYYLFSLIGTKIIAVFSMLIGIAFIANVSLGDIFVKIGKFLQSLFNKGKASINQRKSREITPDIHQETVPERNIPNITEQEGAREPEPLVIHEFSHNSSATEEPN